jgi:hypothetical protein
MVSLHVSYYFQIFGPALILLGVITQAQTSEGVQKIGERKDVEQMGGAAFPYIFPPLSILDFSFRGNFFAF